MTETYTAEMAHAAAARGAAWLDKKCPGWELEVNLADLDLAAPDCCILGQTAHCVTKGKVPSRQSDSFAETLARAARAARARSETGWAAERGFYAPSVWSPDLSSAENIREAAACYEMLTIAWKELIRERLAVTA